MNIQVIIGLAGVIATMSVGGGLIQERSRWLPIVLWVVVVIVGVSLWGQVVGPRPLWSGGRLRDHVPNLTLLGFPSLICLATLLVLHQKSLLVRIGVTVGLGAFGAVAAPFVALWIACAVTDDCL